MLRNFHLKKWGKSWSRDFQGRTCSYSLTNAIYFLHNGIQGNFSPSFFGFPILMIISTICLYSCIFFWYMKYLWPDSMFLYSQSVSWRLCVSDLALSWSQWKGKSFPCPHHAVILRGRGIVLLIVNLGIKWKWMANFTPQLLYPQEIILICTEQCKEVLEVQFGSCLGCSVEWEIICNYGWRSCERWGWKWSWHILQNWPN